MALALRVCRAVLGLFRALLRRQHCPAPCLAPAALRRALGQLCAFRDRNRGSAHDDVPVAHRGLPYEKHILAATLRSDLAPVALFLAGRAGLKLFFGFEESDGRARFVCPFGDPALDKRHCGLARGKLLFAVLDQNVLGHLCCERPGCREARRLPSQFQTYT